MPPGHQRSEDVEQEGPAGLPAGTLQQVALNHVGVGTPEERQEHPFQQRWRGIHHRALDPGTIASSRGNSPRDIS